ncbi:MAG: hexameric tyrosine-coordinated heme protein [Cypionkella sp.]
MPTLITAPPTEGYDLALKPSHVTIKRTRHDATVRDRLRPDYVEDADALIAVRDVVATLIATIAAANSYWRDVR